MSTFSANRLAEDLDFDSAELLFEFLISQCKDSVYQILGIGNFKSLNAAAQNQLLKFCSDNNDDDAYNFYHSLI